MSLKKLATRLSVVVLLLFTVAALAQVGNQGSLEGTVSDASGALVPNASLTATNNATGVSFTTETNQDGLFRFALLPVGTYTLKVGKQGFSEQVRQDVPVTVGGKLNLDFKLAVSGAAETVNVTGQLPLVETTRTNVSTTVDATSVAELPVNGRNFLDFVLLTPGVTRDVRTGDLSFGGQRGTLNSLTVDGADDNNTFFGQTTGRTGSGRAPYQFSQDAVQEFQVNSNGYSAELGRAGGAVINVVTKSGTNAFHGSAFEYYRDRGIAANDPVVKLNHALNPALSDRKPAYHFHQFGGGLGGPIVKNRAFFFFDYDGQRNTQLNTVTLNLPTIAAPTTFQAAALKYLQDHSASWTRGLNQNTYLLKGDWAITGRHQASIRWNRQNFTGLGFESGGSNVAAEHTGASIVNSDTIAAQLTSTLTNSLVNVARFGYQIDQEPGQANTNLPEAAIKQNNGATILTVGRNFFSPRETTIHRQQYADTLTMIRGRHTFKLGADFIHDDIINLFPGNFSGSYTFACLENFGRSLAGQPLVINAALGCPANSTIPTVPADQFVQAFAGTGTTGALTHPNIFEASWFVQDDWRVRRNLTLNLGLRWDLQDTATPPVDNPLAVAAGIHTNLLPTDTNNFGPRIGFAWTPFDSANTVIRGGYGIFYGRTPSILVGTAHSNNGVNVGTKTFRGADMPSYPNTKCGAPVDAPNCAAPTTGAPQATTIFIMAPNYQQPMVQQANLNFERQLSNDFSFSIGWQMVKGNHLQRSRDINLGTPTPIIATIAGTGQTVTYLRYPAARPIAAFSRISQFESTANSLYYGLFIQLKKRMSRNFQGTASYTWSHVIDDVPDATAVVPLGSDDAKLLFDPQCLRCDRASSFNDQRHRFVLSGIWQLNYANDLPSAAKAILGGWEISAILSAQSGQPYFGLVGGDPNGDGNSFTDRLPTEGRDKFLLPATWSLDPRFSKSIKFTERAKLQLFVEAFNIFNHFNVPSVKPTEYVFNSTTRVLTPQFTGVNAFGLPTTPGSGSNYPFAGPGQLNGARIFQLGARASF
jgi:hypothetical protein